MLVKCSNSTILSANNRRVHLACPSGGSEQTKAIRCASFSPSNFGFGGLEGFLGASAAVSPSSTNVFRVLSMVGTETSTASHICSSAYAGPNSLSSAFNKILARVSFRADSIPEEIKSMR